MANKKVNIDITTTANTSGAKQAEKALAGVTAQANRLDVAEANMATGSKLAGFQVGNLGNQVQDAAVQFQMGTSAATIFAQQGPQIASVFGPKGAVVGALLALGVVAAQVFAKMGDDSANTEEAAAKLAEKIKEIGENAKDLEAEDLDLGRDAMEAALSLAQTLAVNYEELASRENAFSSQALRNAEMLRQAEANLRAARGENISQIEEVTAKADEEAAKRRQETQAAINSENARIEAAQQALELSQQTLDRRTEALRLEQEAAARLRAEIDGLKEKRKELEAISKQTVTTGFGPGAGLGTAPVFASSPQAINAQQQLKLGTIDAELAAKIGQLESVTKSAENATGAAVQAVQRAGVGVFTAQQKLAEAQTIAMENIAQIQATFEAADIQGSTAALLQTQTALAAEIKTAIETAQPRTEADRANVEALKGIIADNNVSLQETTLAINSLSQLQGAIPAAFGEVNNNVQELIGVIRLVQQQAASQGREIQKLKQQQRTPGNID